MFGVLQHGCILEKKQVDITGVDIQCIGKAFGLRVIVTTGKPIAESYRRRFALGYGTQETFGTRITLGGVEVHCMSRGSTQISIIYSSVDQRGVVVATAIATDI